ncbi:MAG: SgcJ/EcaC family oxidoreductase [Anaerolineae bacterium]
MIKVFRLLVPALAAVLVIGLFARPASAQDPTKVDSKHYKVVFENDQVRVVHITYGAGEKSVMHYHPANVAVFLNDNQVNFTLPDGKSVDVKGEKGQTVWDAGGMHLPKNTGDKSMEVILVEMKGKHDEMTLRKAIEAQNAKFSAAFNRGDAAGVAALYTENAVTQPPNSEPVHGRQAIQKSFAADLKMGLTDLTLTTVSVEGNGDTAYEIGSYTIKIAPEGKAAMTDSGKYMVVWKQDADGVWKLHADIWNSSLPASTN